MKRSDDRAGRATNNMATLARAAQHEQHLLASKDGAWDDFFDAPGIDLPDREQPAAN